MGWEKTGACEFPTVRHEFPDGSEATVMVCDYGYRWAFDDGKGDCQSGYEFCDSLSDALQELAAVIGKKREGNALLSDTEREVQSAF